MNWLFDSGFQREDAALATGRVQVGHELHRLDGVLAADREDVRLVLDERAEAHQEREQRHVRVELVRLTDPDRVPERLQRRRRAAHVIPCRGRLADRVPEVVPPDDRSGDEVVRDTEVAPRLRVVGAPAPELAVRADLTLDLADDRAVVDHLILVPCRWSQEAEDVVAALGLHLGCGQGRELRVVLEVDADLDVVLLTPGRRPGPEPRVVLRDEVRPLHDGELSREQTAACTSAGPRTRTGPLRRQLRLRHAATPARRSRSDLVSRSSRVSVGLDMLTTATT